MTWLAFRDLKDPEASALGDIFSNSFPSPDLLRRGTLVLEADPLASRASTLDLLRVGPPRALELLLDTDGGISLSCCDKGTLLHVSTTTSTGVEPMRITLRWDAPAKTVEIFVERSDGDAVQHAAASAKCEISTALLVTLFADPGSAVLDDCIAFIALSDQLEPVTPLPTLEAHCPVETPDGWRSIRDIEAGDLVLTEDHGPQPVRNILSREVPTLGQFRPVRLRTPFFGLAQDVLVAPRQLVLVADDMVEYLFGEEEMLAEIGHLADGSSVFPELGTGLVRYCQLVLDRPELLNVAGAPMASHSAPRTHAPMTDAAGPTRPILRPYEALTLRSTRFR